MKKALYLSYTGLLEPLGMSQIFAYLSRLSNEYEFHLVSFEKKELFNQTNLVDSINKKCKKSGINWHPRVYHRKPRLLATVYDVSAIFCFCLILCVKEKISVIHSRSYVAGLCAWVLSKVTRIPFIFDMRALWIDELVIAGRLKKGTILYKILRKLEKCLLKDAAHVVSLTDAAVGYLKQKYTWLSEQNFAVITTCVDLNKFSPASGEEPSDRPVFVVGAMGTLLSGWFHLCWLFRFYLQIKKIRPNTILKIVTRDNHRPILLQASKFGIDAREILILSSAPNKVSDNIADMDVLLMFFAADTGKLGSAPTRLGEALACGIPVAGNSGVGDLGELIRKYNVGVVLEDGRDTSMETAVNELDWYLTTRHTAANCRHAAEDYFSADIGAEKYRKIYRMVTG